MAQVLTGHTSFETAFVINDYPYGFKLRCQKRIWIETTKNGQRVVSATSNPKRPGLVWNKPKASTYTPLRVLYIDPATGYVENAALSFYANTFAVAQFVNTYGAAVVSERDQLVLEAIKRAAAKLDEREAARKAAAEAGGQS